MTTFKLRVKHIDIFYKPSGNYQVESSRTQPHLTEYYLVASPTWIENGALTQTGKNLFLRWMYGDGTCKNYTSTTITQFEAFPLSAPETLDKKIRYCTAGEIQSKLSEREFMEAFAGF